MWRYRRAVGRAEGRTVTFDADDDAVAAIIDRTLERGQGKLSEPDALRVLDAYGIPVAPWRFVTADGAGGLARGAADAAADVGLPVALKIVSPDVVHKTDVGGVMLDLDSKAAVERAVRGMIKTVEEHTAGAAIEGILVQQMRREGRETIVGLTRVPLVGPLVMFGLGGVYVEILKDVVLRLAPLEDRDARDMIREVRMVKLLEGVRGEPARDLDALADAILRVAQLAERHPRIAEMDINPLLALEEGAVAVDARVQVAPGPDDDPAPDQAPGAPGS